MIVGVGIDVVDITRFERSLARTPGLAGRLFTEGEKSLPSRSLAVRFAAKEALAKALGAPRGLLWTDAEIVTAASGRPRLQVTGTVAAAATRLGVTSWHLSLSHDAGIASAVVIVEGDKPAGLGWILFRFGRSGGPRCWGGRLARETGDMRDAYSVSQVRAAEARLFALVPDGALMQRAAAGLAAVCADLLRAGAGGVYGARVVVFAGTGDNGGDALYAGARLARRGASVSAVQAGARIHAEAARALVDAGGRIIPVVPPRDPDATRVGPGSSRPDARAARSGPAGEAAAGEAAAGGSGRHDVGHEARSAVGRADLIIDGMLGIGGKGGLREPYATLAELAAQAKNATTVAVDLPSGIDADTGTVAGPAVRADVTVTFGAVKPGLLVDPGAGHAGVVEVVDIGLGAYLEGVPAARAPQAGDIAGLLPRPAAESDKYRRGVVGLLVGSDRYTGAALLATGGAVRGGAGMVRLVTFPGAAAAVRPVHPEVVITELESGTRTRSEGSGIELRDGNGQFPQDVGRVQAWAAGSGMGTDDAAARRLAAVLATSLPVLIDADGLTLLARHRELLPRSAPTLLTPHAGELGRLLDADPADIEARRLEHAQRAAATLGACVLLKGSTTVVAPPDGHDPVLVNTTGTPWLATAGTGDVLAGLAGALLAQGLTPPQAAIAAAYLHGLAARLAARGAGGALAGEAPIGASDVVAALPGAFRHCGGYGTGFVGGWGSLPSGAPQTSA